MSKIEVKFPPKKENNETETGNLRLQMAAMFAYNDEETTKESELSSC